MKGFANLKRLGFFTRLLDEAAPAERYRLAVEQIMQAERAGLDSTWIAQHHFHEREGGLPAPFAFLGFVAAQTRRIRLGTGIVTLPLENPVRVAEDAAVLDLLAGGRLSSASEPAEIPRPLRPSVSIARSATTSLRAISTSSATRSPAGRSRAAICFIRSGLNYATGSGRRHFP